MEKNFDYNVPYNGYDYMQGIPNDDPFMNSQVMSPIAQYEQMYMYYKFLTQQLEYKMKCKEYNRLYKNEARQ